MRFTEQIINCLNRVERAGRNLDKQGNPVAHCTIPQARQLKRTHGFTLNALTTDEACLLVDE